MIIMITEKWQKDYHDLLNQAKKCAALRKGDGESLDKELEELLRQCQSIEAEQKIGR